jgi:hypothetical protein
MRMGIAALVFIPLLAVAIAHFVWSFGGTWPLRNRELLVRTVYGRPGTQRMPPRPLTFAVAVGILTAGIIALSLADDTAGGLWLDVIGIGLGLLFIARGIIGYTSQWRAVFSEEPFATLDRRNYSPLALGLGVGFFVLVLMRLL